MVAPAASAWEVRYVFAKPVKPVTVTSNTQSPCALPLTRSQSCSAVARSSGFAGGSFGSVQPPLSGGQLRSVNVAVDVPGA